MIETMLQRGDIYYADLAPVVGCEQGGMRPVLILQNNVGNQYSPTTIVAAITSRKGKHYLPTHIRINGYSYGLRTSSVVMLEQIRTLDRSRLCEYMGHLNDRDMKSVDQALAISVGLRETKQRMSMC